MADFSIKDLNSAISKTRREQGSGEPQGNLIMRLTGINDKDNSIEGEVVAGSGKGRQITVDLSDSKSQKSAKDYKSGKTKMQVGPETATGDFSKDGGYMRLEGVRPGDGGQFKCGYCLTMMRDPKDHALEAEQDSTLIETRRFTSSGYPIKFMQSVNGAEAKDVSGMDSIVDAMAEVLENNDGAMIMGVDSDKDAGWTVVLRGGSKKDGEYVKNDPRTAAENAIGLMNDVVKETLDQCAREGHLLVAPVSSRLIGGQTGQEMDEEMEKAASEGRRPSITTINPADSRIPSLGIRMAQSMRRPDVKEVKDVLQENFHDFLSGKGRQDDIKALASKGWPAVSDASISEFFAENGVNLPERTGAAGFSSQTIVMQTGYDAPMAIKSFRTGAVMPNPTSIEACKEANNKYRNELPEAIKAVMPNLTKGSKNEAEKDEKPDTSGSEMREAQEEAPASAASDEAARNMDSILGDIDDQEVNI